MIELKTKKEIDLIKEAGNIVNNSLLLAKSLSKVGKVISKIDDEVEDFIIRSNAIPLFKGYHRGEHKQPYPCSTCISINNTLVHGVPNERKLRQGDLVKIDTACKLNGWCADAAICFVVGYDSDFYFDISAFKLMVVVRKVLDLAIRNIKPGRKWSEIAQEMEKFVVDNGFYVVKELSGHGIGRELHELPHVLNFYNTQYDFLLEPGLVIAIEPMITEKETKFEYGKNGWDVKSSNFCLTAHCEHTIAVTENGVLVLTNGDI